MKAHIPDTQCNVDLICEAYYLSNKKRASFPLRTSVSSHVFVLVHFDVWGPFAKPIVQGHHYFLTIVDDYLGILVYT